jgi:hypothetical protein
MRWKKIDDHHMESVGTDILFSISKSKVYLATSLA